METANGKFLKGFLDNLRETESTPKPMKDDEDIFFKILNAGTVGELYDMDISIEDVERLIPNSELLLRKAEGSFWFCKFMAENIHRIQGQKKKKFIF